MYLLYPTVIKQHLWRGLLLFVFVNIRISTHAQNLVPNPSFEDYISCPGGLADFSVENWYYPTIGTSDYFNICAIPLDSASGVPLNLFGYQHPRTGNAYTGFAAYFGIFLPNYREYMQVELMRQLEKDHIYELSFYVSLADSSTLAVTDIGALLTEAPISSSTYDPLNHTPQVLSPKNVYMSNIQDWVQVKGYIVAEGNEKYLTIGYFVDNSNADTLRIYNSIFFDLESYYYIDDVSVNEMSDVSLANIFTPNGDGINDVFDLEIDCPFCDFTMEIYDRWGQLMIENQTYKWDGSFKGNQCSDGVYYFVLKSKSSGVSHYSGYVQLQR